MATEFIHNGITYRTNGDASVVEGLDGKTWNRTGSMGVREAALKALKPGSKTSAELDFDLLKTIGIKLGGTKYRVTSGSGANGRGGMDLVGARGGKSILMQSPTDHALWMHIVAKSSGRALSTMYRRESNGTFTRI